MKKLLHSLSFRVFVLFVVCALLPVFCVFTYVKMSYEKYLQEQISTKIIQTIAKSEEGVYRTFQNMAGVSSAFVADTRLREGLSDPSISFYERTKRFDECMKNLTVANLYGTNDTRVTLFDAAGKMYANWNVNYEDYTFLLQQSWVQQSREEDGYVVWNLFSPTFSHGKQQDADPYISLARSILQDGTTAGYLGTLIVSIPQEQLGALLEQYQYSKSDSIFVCVDGGAVVMSRDNGNVKTEEVQQACAKLAPQGSGGMVVGAGSAAKLVSCYTLSDPWTLDGKRLHVIHFTDYAPVQTQMNQISGRMNAILLICILAVLIVVWFVAIAVVRPVRTLAHQMRIYQVGNEPDLSGIRLNRSDEIGHLNRSFLAMSGNITQLFDKLNEEYRVREKYRFEALRAQLNPHFLFNTLGTVRCMAAMQGTKSIAECIDALADMLQYCMARGEETVPLSREINNIKSYLYIQNMRYGNRLMLETDFPAEVLDLFVIKFILQPIVENSVLHGFAGKAPAENCILRIYGDREDECLVLYVEDNGCGVPDAVSEHLEKSGHRSNNTVTGLGLNSVNERIRTAYGDAYGLSIANNPAGGAVVCYRLPILEKEEETDEKDPDC